MHAISGCPALKANLSQTQQHPNSMSSRTVLRLATTIFPNISVPAEENHLRSMMLPPPYSGALPGSPISRVCDLYLLS